MLRVGNEKLIGTEVYWHELGTGNGREFFDLKVNRNRDMKGEREEKKEEEIGRRCSNLLVVGTWHLDVSTIGS